jgi:hypothetical protein
VQKESGEKKVRETRLLYRKQSQWKISQPNANRPRSPVRQPTPSGLTRRRKAKITKGSDDLRDAEMT